MSVSFADLGVSADLIDALKQRNITEPFPIQAATIKDALAGRDISGRAPTGSGKTLAFGIPMVERVPRARRLRPGGLILAPTRELAAQIQKDLLPLAKTRGRRVISVYGGVGYDTQVRELRRGVDILVACPGRLIDLVERRAVELDGIEIVVIDEADRMADMGFLPQVRKLLDLVSENRQTILFSATLDGDIGSLTREYQNDPVRHEVGEVEPDLDASTHAFWHIEATDRPRHTATLVEKHGSTIVFCRTRHGADRLVKQLSASGVRAGVDPRWSLAEPARSRAAVVQAGSGRRARRHRRRRARHPRRRCRVRRALRPRRGRQGVPAPFRSYRPRRRIRRGGHARLRRDGARRAQAAKGRRAVGRARAHGPGSGQHS